MVSAAEPAGVALAACEDAFAASVTAELKAPQAAVLTHSQLEDQLGTRMREVTRQLFQDHLTLRARDEVRLGEVVDAAGVERTRIERGRRRRLVTVFGKVTVARFTQFCSVPSCTPSSRATCAAGLPVSVTILTAPARNSASKEARFSAMTLNFPSGLDSTLRGEPQSNETVESREPTPRRWRR